VTRQLPRAARRRIALAGVVAILFQAILFGWHHHPLVLAAPGVPPAIHGEGSAPLSPVTAEDDCDICQALHNLSAAPGEFVSLAPPAGALASPTLPEPVRLGRRSPSAFQARAPPRA
jgi:hypothetical protein